ncbi:RHS repeat domain-containing protein [Aquimarina mytili]|uniref:RHS repeat-associated core domain-containing protein n=1 Tax=Aquimarina mytili TaxID=874423 RepID=A0A936ZT45_9FLAO|nr:RHS repeat-associated core domain-containing protein [Aquimarina mytili]MBL0684183.1 hypothetical protein [Aquimarina mytili]
MRHFIIDIRVWVIVFLLSFAIKGNAQCRLTSFPDVTLNPISSSSYVEVRVASLGRTCRADIIFTNIPTWVSAITNIGGTRTRTVEIDVVANTSGASRSAVINYDLEGDRGTFTITQSTTNTDLVPENHNTVTTVIKDVMGKTIGTKRSYFDPLGKPVQSQSKDFKTGKTWASQTLYDHQGRAAVSTLNAPIGNAIGYKSDFVKKADGTTFSINDFETTDLENPSIVGTQANTLGWYYSESNIDDPNTAAKEGESFQDITDRPYSRVIYSELNGAPLKTIGGNKMGGEWKNGYAFSMPAGQELSQSVAFGQGISSNHEVIKTVYRNVHGIETVVFTDTDGRALASARSGNEEENVPVRYSTIDVNEQNFVDIHIPKGTKGIVVKNYLDNELTNSPYFFKVYDLTTEEVITTEFADLPPGLYRIASITVTNNWLPKKVTYPENYYDYNLNEYDKAGRLLSAKQPLDHEKLESTFRYNSLGQLEYANGPDEGDTWILYREDGQIRFSINSKQWKNKEFSYTNYDHRGRPIESGVYTDENLVYIKAYSTTVTDITDPFNDALKNIVDDKTHSFNIDNRTERNITTYDKLENTDATFLSNLNGYETPSFLYGSVAKTQNENTTTYYSYDIYGRVVWIVQDIAGLGVKIMDYEYDPVTSQVNKVLYQKGKADQFIHQYTYDVDDYSLIKVETSNDGTKYTEHAQYNYYETGALKRINLAEGLQGVDYVYNINGALKSINHVKLDSTNDPGGDSDDVFGMNIGYYYKDYSRTNTPTPVETTMKNIHRYNGDISSIVWKNKGLETNQQSYSFLYNKNNWLQGASYGASISPSDLNVYKTIIKDQPVTETETVEASQEIYLKPGFSMKATTQATFLGKISKGAGVNPNLDYNVYNITYDANGNIKTLNRNKNKDGSGNNSMDQLSYTYKDNKPNQLLRVDDASDDVAGADDIGDQNGDNYVYNEIGQLIENKAENINYIYNASGLVIEVQKNNTPLVKFFYNDKGHRVRKESYNPDTGRLAYTEHYVRDAAGTAMAIYRNKRVVENTIYGSNRLGVIKSDGTRLYEITDHLGNVRAVVGRDPKGGVMNDNIAVDYYPGGMAMPGRSSKSDYRYGYQGKFAETDPETGKPAFELRLYDPRINRWLTTDPMGEFNSPYLAMGNNWINLVDPTGGMTDPPTDYDLGSLDEVIINAPGSGGGGLQPNGINIDLLWKPLTVDILRNYVSQKYPGFSREATFSRAGALFEDAFVNFASQNPNLLPGFYPSVDKSSNRIPDGYSTVAHMGNRGLMFYPGNNYVEVKTKPVTLTAQIQTFIDELALKGAASGIPNYPVSLTFVTPAGTHIRKDVYNTANRLLRGTEQKVIHITAYYKMTDNHMRVSFSTFGNASAHYFSNDVFLD